MSLSLCRVLYVEGILEFPPRNLTYTCKYRTARVAVQTLCGFSATYNMHDVELWIVVQFVYDIAGETPANNPV